MSTKPEESHHDEPGYGGSGHALPVSTDAPEALTPLAEADYADPRQPLYRALRFALLALVAFTVFSLIAWGAGSGLPGIYGVLVGAAIGGSFALLTLISVLVTAKSTPAITGAVILGGWLVKMMLLAVVLYAIKDLTFYHRGALVVTTLVAAVVVIVGEVWGIVSSKILTVT